MHPFQKKYNEVIIKDQSFIKPFMLVWDYQIKKKQRGRKYTDDKPQDFFEFKNEKDLISWFNWFDDTACIDIKSKTFDELILKSKLEDERILKLLGVKYDFEKYNSIGSNNAADNYFPQLNLFPLTEIKHVLDFGSGYGRQANLWWQQLKGKGNFISVDAIPLSYGLQNSYCKALSNDVIEYIDDVEQFKIDLNTSHIYHLPTWRFDLIESNSLDLIMCVQVLPEINVDLIKYLTHQFNRILKEGGLLYIRDTGSLFKAIGFNYDAHFAKNGFVLEHTPVSDLKNQSATKIRLYRYLPNYKKEKVSIKKRIRFVLESIEAIIKNK